MQLLSDDLDLDYEEVDKVCTQYYEKEAEKSTSEGPSKRNTGKNGGKGIKKSQKIQPMNLIQAVKLSMMMMIWM